MMKKIFALFVALAMVLCFASCDGTRGEIIPNENACVDHVDSDGDGMCDTDGCGATVEVSNDGGDTTPGDNGTTENGNGNSGNSGNTESGDNGGNTGNSGNSGNTGNSGVAMDSMLATTYTNAIFDAIENAKTVTAAVTLIYKKDAGDSLAIDDGRVVREGNGIEVSLDLDVTLAMSENGLNFKILGDAITTRKQGDKVQSANEKMEAYIVDGVSYFRAIQGDEWGDWAIDPIEMPENTNGMITQLVAIIAELAPGEFEVTPEMIEEMKLTFTNAITVLMTVKPDGSFGARVDAKDSSDALVEFLKGIKAEDTASEVINRFLAMSNLNFTVEALLDEIGTCGAVTVGELYAYFNEVFVTELGVGINDAKNAILTEERIVAILVENGVADESMIAKIKAMDLDALATEYAEMTLDDVAYAMLAAQSASASSSDVTLEPDELSPDDALPEESINTEGTFAMLIARIKSMLTMTAAEAFGGKYEDFVATVNGIEVRESYSYVTFKVSDDLSIEKVEYGEKQDLTYMEISTIKELVGGDDGSDELVIIKSAATVTTLQDLVVNITSVSNQETVIEAPEIKDASPAA